jgi:hypothetical protein
MTYSIPRCDRTGWFLGKKVRVPSTYNYKYHGNRQEVQVVDYSERLYDIVEIDMLPPLRDLEVKGLEDDDEEWLQKALAIEKGPQELLATIRSNLPSRVVAQYDVETRDRSAALWALTTAAFRAGMRREEVFHLAMHSANNKFKDLKYGGVRELAKDILRAEATVHTRSYDARTKVAEARKLPGLVIEKRAYIAGLIKEHLQRTGQFIHCNDGSGWYIRDDTGRPIAIVTRSETLQSMIDVMYGINATEPESPYVIHSLISHYTELPAIGTLAGLSHYDVDSKTLLVHSGRKDVLRVSAEKIDTVANGFNSVVFPWSLSNEVVEPNYTALDLPWDRFIFDECLHNVIGVAPESARALLRVWFITMLLRNAVVARPILALFGQPGAGKSTLFRRLYVLIYGRNRSLNAVTTPDDFDYAVASDPLVVLDNVDTWEKWLPDRLALSAATSEITKRKLYTNAETVTLRRQAMLGITAHNPKFGREDVTDRLILLTFERLQHFQSETAILGRISDLRNALWGSILSDVQRVFRTPLPTEGFPQFRVEDFARFGHWIALALGVEKEFADAIAYVRDAQKSFVLEEDGIIVTAIRNWLDRNDKVGKDPDLFYTAGQLMSQLSTTSGDEKAFTLRYANAVSLGRKLWSLQDSLKEMFDIKWENDRTKGARTWRIRRRRDG